MISLIALNRSKNGEPPTIAPRSVGVESDHRWRRREAEKLNLIEKLLDNRWRKTFPIKLLDDSFLID